MTDPESPEVHDRDLYDLRPGPMDHLATAVRAASELGSIGPVPGGAIGELIASTLPNQRVDKMARFVRLIDARVLALEDMIQERLEENIRETPYLDLLGEGLNSAASALSDERLTHIAELVSRGLSGNEAAALQRLFLLGILDQLNDAEIIILRSMEEFPSSAEREEFYSTNEAIFSSQVAVMDSPPEEIDAVGVYRAYKEHLENLGLIQHRYETGSRGEIPELDARTGRPRRRTPEISILGRLLLREIGLLKDEVS